MLSLSLKTLLNMLNNGVNIAHSHLTQDTRYLLIILIIVML
ncbi:hypothetical protein THOD04_20117 [Vibrio owensii]|nr:hypothetical protein THOD04_20117 [Vibrio owensii]